jgi:hypothetical protein
MWCSLGMLYNINALSTKYGCTVASKWGRGCNAQLLPTIVRRLGMSIQVFRFGAVSDELKAASGREGLKGR